MVKLIENTSYDNILEKIPYTLLIAKMKANKGLLVESEELCMQVIKDDKINESAYYLLATVQSEQGKSKDAIDALNKTLFPHSIDLHSLHAPPNCPSL